MIKHDAIRLGREAGEARVLQLEQQGGTAALVSVVADQGAALRDAAEQLSSADTDIGSKEDPALKRIWYQWYALGAWHLAEAKVGGEDDGEAGKASVAARLKKIADSVGAATPSPAVVEACTEAYERGKEMKQRGEKPVREAEPPPPAKVKPPKDDKVKDKARGR